MRIESVASVPYGVVLVPERPVSQSGGRFRMVVKSPIGLDVPGDGLVSTTALVVDADLSQAREVTLPGPLFDASLLPPGGYALVGVLTPPAGSGRPPAAFASRFTIPGTGSSVRELVEDFDTIIAVPPYDVRIRCNGTKYRTGEDSLFRYSVQEQGQPVELFPPGSADRRPSLFFVSADLLSVVTAEPIVDAGHPLARHAAELGNGAAADVLYHATFARPGLYRAFVTFRHRGTLIPTAYTINVLDSDHPDVEGSSTTPSPNADPAHHHYAK
jgi:hypothetical protein